MCVSVWLCVCGSSCGSLTVQLSPPRPQHPPALALWSGPGLSFCRAALGVEVPGCFLGLCSWEHCWHTRSLGGAVSPAGSGQPVPSLLAFGSGGLVEVGPAQEPWVPSVAAFSTQWFWRAVAMVAKAGGSVVSFALRRGAVPSLCLLCTLRVQVFTVSESGLAGRF